MLIVVSKVKAEVKARVGKDALEALSEHVENVIKQAERNAKEDGVETIKARHVESALAGKQATEE